MHSADATEKMFILSENIQFGRNSNYSKYHQLHSPETSERPSRGDCLGFPSGNIRRFPDDRLFALGTGEFKKRLKQGVARTFGPLVYDSDVYCKRGMAILEPAKLYS